MELLGHLEEREKALNAMQQALDASQEVDTTSIDDMKAAKDSLSAAITDAKEAGVPSPLTPSSVASIPTRPGSLPPPAPVLSPGMRLIVGWSGRGVCRVWGSVEPVGPDLSVGTHIWVRAHHAAHTSHAAPLCCAWASASPHGPSATAETSCSRGDLPGSQNGSHGEGR